MNWKIARKVVLLIISIVNVGLATGASSLVALDLKVALEDEEKRKKVAENAE